MSALEPIGRGRLTRRSQRVVGNIDADGLVDEARIDDIVRRAQMRAAALVDVTGSAGGEAVRLAKLKSNLEMMAPEASGVLAALEEINTIGLISIVSRAQRDLGRLR